MGPVWRCCWHRNRVVRHRISYADTRGGLSYFSMPNGAAQTEFEMTSHEAQRVVFSNPAHDFPQRVIYERSGDTLHARIEGEVEERTDGVDWNFRRAEADARCRR